MFFAKKNTVNTELKRNHHKLYMNVKAMKSAIREILRSNLKPTEAQKLQPDDAFLRKLISYYTGRTS